MGPKLSGMPAAGRIATLPGAFASQSRCNLTGMSGQSSQQALEELHISCGSLRLHYRTIKYACGIRYDGLGFRVRGYDGVQAACPPDSHNDRSYMSCPDGGQFSRVCEHETDCVMPDQSP